MSSWPLSLMIYGAGEAVNGASALAPEIAAQLANLATVCTNQSVAAISQLDASDVPTQRQVLDPSGQQPVFQVPNVDVGDPAQLTAFVAWASAICPAERTVLVLSGHGAAWQDSMIDQVLGAGAQRGLDAAPAVPGAIHHPQSLFGADINPVGSMTKAVLVDGHDRDYLSNAELGVACADIQTQLGHPIDVLVFDACLMSSWEILQELSGSVSTVVASIDELSAAGIDMARPAAQFTAAQGLGDAKELAAGIASNFTPKATFDSCVAVDLTTSNWTSALSSFRDFCGSAQPWTAAAPANAVALTDALRLAATSVVEYSSGGLADVKVFADSVSAIPSLPAAAAAAVQAAAAALGQCILARSAGTDYQSALGVSVFAPGSTTVYSTNRAEYIRLQFASLTGWGALLDTLYGFTNETTRFLIQPPAIPMPVGATASNFVISLAGIPLDAATQDRIDKVIQRTVIQKLADLDLLGDVTITPMATALAAVRALGGRPGRQGPLGMNIDPNTHEET